MDSHAMQSSVSKVRPTGPRHLSVALALALAACGGGSSSPSATAHSIQGTVVLGGSAAAGVSVTLSGAGAASVRTDAAGHYAFTDLASGSYTVTPACDGCAFDPATWTVALSDADVAGVDFAGTAPQLTWSGGNWDHVVWQ